MTERPFTYGSVCSGIEAATQAWQPLGWRCAFVSEIEDFARAVLEHHHPEVPLHADFTTIQRGDYDPIDLLVGGTPCQSFSIAGLRGGLGDDRGNLALEYLRLADRLRPRWLVWENVPGVLSSGGGRDFGAIVGGMVELGYGAAWRVLDAQYVRTLPFPWAVPQRRRRVFLVGHLGDWRRAAAVLFDRESLQGNPPPRREAGKAVAPTLSARPTGGGGLGTDFDLDGGVIATSHEASQPLLAKGNSSHRADAESYVAVANSGDVGYCLAASAQQSLDAETETLLAYAFNSRQDPDAWEERTGPLDSRTDQAQAIAVAVTGEVTHALNTANNGKGCSEDGTGRGVPTIAQGWAVRRLTPVECERLQGFPDDFTNIPWRGKPTAPDGRRYKALGNSMAVNVMRWLGDRIDLVRRIPEDPS